MAEQEKPLTFTDAVAQLDKDGFDSMGFGLEDGLILCVDCGTSSSHEDVKVGGLLAYETDDGGEGLVLVLRCPSCSAKGMLFAAPDVRASEDGPIVEALAAKARHEDG